MRLNRTIAPKLNPIAGLPYFKIESFKLSNDIPIQYINAGSQELVKLQILFPAGIIYQNKSLQAFFTAKMLKEGSRNYISSKIAETLDFYGAFLDIKTNRDHAIIHLICLNKHLKEIFPIIVDFLNHPLFAEKELKVMIEQEKQNFLHRNEKGKVQAQKAFNKELFGANHPYGSTAILEDFDKIERRDLVDFFQSNYILSQAKVYLAGFISDDVFDPLHKYIGELQIDQKSFSSTTIPYPDTKPQNLIIPKENALQTAIRMGKLFPDRKSSDFPALALTQTILGGFFGSRLMQNIREDKGYTYGIHSNIQHMKHASIFSIASEVGSDVSELTINEIEKELKRLQNEFVSEEELNLVKNYMSGSLLRSLNGPFALGEMLKTIDEFELEEQYYKYFLQGIQNTSSEDVLRIANAYLQADSFTSVRVGK